MVLFLLSSGYWTVPSWFPLILPTPFMKSTSVTPGRKCCLFPAVTLITQRNFFRCISFCHPQFNAIQVNSTNIFLGFTACQGRSVYCTLSRTGHFGGTVGGIKSISSLKSEF